MPAERGAIERELQFSREDLERFASASGDRNPLHIDPDFARRTPFGSCIVHGALVAVGMVGTLPPAGLSRICSLRLRFSGPVLPGTTARVRAEPAPTGGGAWNLRLTARGKVLARGQATPGRDPVQASLRAAESLLVAAPVPTAVRARRATPAALLLDELPAGHTIDGDYAAGAELSLLAAQFGAETLAPSLLEGLAWASYVVGMELPGLHSLFGGLVLASSEPPAGGGAATRQSIRLRDYDSRTGQVIVDGVLRDGSGAARSLAVIEGFARAPIAAPDREALACATTSEHAGEAVAVIGGSRGFGASISLALLARGYSVHVAYSSSSASAAELVRSTGPGGARIHLHRCDARDPAAVRALLAGVREHDAELTGLVLNAALPPLAMGLTGDSGPELAEYVAESVRLAAVPLGSLLPMLAPDGGWVLFVSSSAVCAPPRDWPHYVTAKAAIEGLARWVAATLPSARTVVVRPPAMRTDLTNTPSARIAAVPTETVAAWVVDHVIDPELPAGLSVLEPGVVPAAQA